MALARNYAERLENSSDAETAQLAAAAVHRREHLSKRVVISSVQNKDVCAGPQLFPSRHRRSSA